MQDAAIEHWMTFDKKDSVDLDDFGFYHDWQTVASMGAIFVLSGYRVLPYAGGWLDQPADIADDLLTYIRGLAWGRSQQGDVQLPQHVKTDWTDL